MKKSSESTMNLMKGHSYHWVSDPNHILILDVLTDVSGSRSIVLITTMSLVEKIINYMTDAACIFLKRDSSLYILYHMRLCMMYCK